MLFCFLALSFRRPIDRRLIIKLSSLLIFPLLCGGMAVLGSPSDGELRRSVIELLNRYEMYGLSGSVLIEKDGRILVNQGVGMADVESKTRVSPATAFDAGSLAKTFTAAAILLLEERGRLSTTDLISTYLGPVPEDKKQITIHHLLTHTSGLALDASDIGSGATDSADVFVQKAKSAKLISLPGQQYHYSNVGYGLLARIIEDISKTTWQKFVRVNLLNPAGLSSTSLYGERSRGRVAVGYIGESEQEITTEPALKLERPDAYVWRKYTLGSVGVITTTGDLRKWWRFLNSEKAFSGNARKKMFTPQAFTQGYGWNISPTTAGKPRIYRGGLRGSFQSLIAWYPADRTLIVYALNKNITGLTSRWAGILWKGLENVLSDQPYFLPPRLMPQAPAIPTAGEYPLLSGGKFILQRKDQMLILNSEGQPAVDALLVAQGRPGLTTRKDIVSPTLSLVRDLSDNKETALLQYLTAEQLRALAAKWREWKSVLGSELTFRHLGTSSGAGGNPRVFVRIAGNRGSITVRFLWDLATERVLAWGDEQQYPLSIKLLPAADGDWVSVDLDTSKTIRVRFIGEQLRIVGEDKRTIAEAIRR